MDKQFDILIDTLCPKKEENKKEVKTSKKMKV